jgi:uncharacterized protein YkwD
MVRFVSGLRRAPALAALLLALGIGLIAGTKPARAAQYQAEAPGPVGELRVTRPALTWKVAPVGETKITEVELTLNGAPVPARYAEQTVAYTPEEPLAPGPYAVKCTVMLDGEWPVSKSWQFSISAAAQSGVAPPDAVQKSALTIANAYRRTLGLPPLRLDPRLCAAARAHSDYLEKNGMLGHDQQPDRPGYLAGRPDQRRAVFGYAGGCYENIDQGSGSVEAAVRGLFDAPYHRIAFLQPGSPEFGAGIVGSRTTLEVGTTAESGIVVYPSDGQREVPTRWEGNELPDPLRLHVGRSPVGYAITFFYFSPQGGRVRVAHARLTNGQGAPVPIYLNTPENDEELKNGALLIPRQPLQPGGVYNVAVTATTESGETLSRTWKFTTSGERQLAQAPLTPDLAGGIPADKLLEWNPVRLPRRRQNPAKRLLGGDKKSKRILVPRAEEEFVA